MTLPLVDFAHTADPGASIDAGLADYGFLRLANIGIEPDELDEVFATSAAFFRSDAAFKRQFLYRSAVENFGYQGLLEENLDPTAPADLKETFTMRNILRSPLGDERWPSPQFREVMTRFYAHALSCAHDIQRRMAEPLGVPEDFFVRVHSGETVTLRLLYYPSSGAPQPDPAQLGAGAHTDYGFLTLLFQHGVGGLQVMDSQGNWIDVPPRGDAVVVNSGDLLEHWTNGKYKSTLHRVIAKTGDRDRLAIAMFLDPDADTVVEVLPSCVSPDNPARFAATSAGAHLQSKLEATHKGRFAQ
jgi:isopenicillin N synthase-like dioxygenase